MRRSPVRVRPAAPLPSISEDGSQKAQAALWQGQSRRSGAARHIPAEIVAPVAQLADILRAVKRARLADEALDHSTVIEQQRADREGGWHPVQKVANILPGPRPYFHGDGRTALFFKHEAGSLRRAAGKGVKAVARRGSAPA